MSRATLPALLLLAAFATRAHAQIRHVPLTADDGMPLTASAYEPADQPAPAILLLHMLGRSRADWDETARRLRDAGFLVLALEFRPVSGSASEPKRDLTPLVRDAQAALAYMKSHPDVAAGRIGVAGASVGASVAALIAADDPAVRSLALVSPALDYRGLRCEAAMRRFGSRSALLVASMSDPYAVRTAKQLSTGAPNREVLVTETQGHGTVLLARQPGLISLLVDWFQRTLL